MTTEGKPVRVSGYVYDENNKPIFGVTISNAYDSTTTNDAGYFLLAYNYQENKGTLTFYSVGFESQTKDISKEVEFLKDDPIINIEFIRNFILKSNATINTVELVFIKDNKFFINGFVVDESGKAIDGAVVKLEYFKPIPIPELSTLNIPLPALPALLPIPPTPLHKTVITDRNGIFEFGNSNNWNLDKASLTINFPEYNEKVVDLTNAYSEDVYLYNNRNNPDPNQARIFDVGRIYPTGRINLSPKTTPIVAEEEIKTKIKRSAVDDTSDIGFMQRLLIATIKIFNAALDRLIPYLTNMLLAFGPALANAALQEAKAAAVKLCPSTDKLSSLIIARNSLVDQINVLYNGVKVLNQLSSTTSTLINGLTAALNLYYIAPYPSIGIPALGLPPLTAGTISFIDNARQTLKEDLDKSNGILKSVGIVVAYCLGILAYILTILNVLDQIILACAKEKQVNFATLNPEITSAINTSINDNIIQNNTTYKGFKLELKLDTINNTAYPKRYAQALNVQGVAVLKTDSSFASNPQVLIDQLKFIIDSNPNLTAG
jgi:hypothetical protein